MMAPYVDLTDDIIRKNAAQLAALCRREGPVWRKCEKPFDTPGNTGVNSENVVLNGYYISWEDLKRLPSEKRQRQKAQTPTPTTLSPARWKHPFPASSRYTVTGRKGDGDPTGAAIQAAPSFMFNLKLPTP